MFKIIRYEISGVKNIKDKITIDFSNATLSSKSSILSKSKAIYGDNGVGKSAIIDSIQIFRCLALYDAYFCNHHISSLFNNQRPKFYFNVIFSVTKNNKAKYFSYELKVSLKDNYLVIEDENYYKVTGLSLNALTKSPIYQIQNGTITYFDSKKLYNKFYEKTVNLLKRSTFSSLLINSLNKLDLDIAADEKDFISTILLVPTIFRQIHVYSELGESRLNKAKLDNKYVELLSEYNINLSKIDRKVFNLSSENEDLIKVDELDDYLTQMKFVTKYLRVHNNLIQNIEIEKFIDRDYFHIKKYIVYENYKINISNESKGIKKLVELYSYLDNAVNGEIVFIDDFDSNIAVPYLTNFLQYMQEEGTGTLCFTAHNPELMNYLKKFKKSIDFLGSTREIVPRVKNGNYSPDKQYIEGFIEGNPFNVAYFDFGPAFYHDDEKQPIKSTK